MAMIPAANPPPTLGAMMARVVAVFAATGDPTEFKCGKEFLREIATGTAPIVVFVPHDAGGKVGPAIRLGDVATITYSCSVFLRAPRVDTAGNFERYDKSDALGRRLIAVLGQVGAGRLVITGAFDDPAHSDPNAIDTYETTLSLGFQFTSRAWKDPQAQAVAPQPVSSERWSPAHLPAPVAPPTPAAHVHPTINLTHKA